MSDAVFQHLGLTLEDEHYRTPGTAYCKRLIALVQYQYGVVNHHMDFQGEATSF